MQNIEVQRYAHPKGYAGCIQPDDHSWIVFLDESGRPSLYWSERDDLGGVLGDPVVL